MALANYTDLQASIANWLGRSGSTDFTSIIPDLVVLAEQRIFFGAMADGVPFPSPALRIRAMEQTTDPTTFKTTAAVQTLALPTGFLKERSIALNTSPTSDLDFATEKEIFDQYGSDSDRPSVYTMRGDNILFGPTPDSAYGVILTYYKKFDALSVTATNWLLTNAPGVYLYATLLEAQPFIRNDARLPIWAAMYAAAIGGLQASDEADRYGGKLVMRSDASVW